MSGTNGHKGTPRKGAKDHSNRFVAQALAMMMLGASVQEISDKLAIPKQTISEWRAYLPAELGQVRTKKEDVEDLLGQYLEKSLRAILAQLDVIGDPDWIRTQTAGELATLHGVVFDKSVRVYDAARRAAEQRTAGENLAARALPAAGEDQGSSAAL